MYSSFVIQRVIYLTRCQVSSGNHTLFESLGNARIKGALAILERSSFFAVSSET